MRHELDYFTIRTLFIDFIVVVGVTVGALIIVLLIMTATVRNWNLNRNRLDDLRTKVILRCSENNNYNVIYTYKVTCVKHTVVTCGYCKKIQ